MAKTSGTAAEILDLPAGGGAVSSAGSTFSVDLNTGAAAAAFSFTLPAGPNAIAPPLQLQYSSGAGDGPFGIGWSLGLMTIRRRVSPTAETPDPNTTGTFVLDGVGDLVAMGGNRYRPAIDATGLRITYENGSWSVVDSRDVTYTLGTTSNAQIGSGPAAWLVDRCTDTLGNAVTYTWLADGEARVPQTIAWGTYQLVFTFEPRPDFVIDGTYGAPTVLTKRCNGIELHVTTEAQSLVRSWTFLYDDASGRGRSLLATIRETGHAADGSTLVAPDRTHGYAKPGAARLVAVDGFTSSLTDVDTDLADLDGNGLPDLVRLGHGVPTVAPNLGGGRFGAPRPLSRAPSPLRLSGSSVTFADMQGNGSVDVLVLDRRFAGYFPLEAPGGSGPPSFGAPVQFSRAPAVIPSDPRVRFLDLNGDGITDVLVDTGRAWLMYLRDETQTWSEVPRVLAADRTPPVSLTDPRVYLADMTGDERTDIVLANGSGITYWPARADGGWDAAQTMTPSPAFGRDHDPRRLALVDVDGDGCADLVYVDATSVTWWRNIGAGRLADPIVVDATPLASPGTYRIVDLLGSGTAGVYFQLPPTGAGATRAAFLDLCGGVKPYLLTDAANGASQSTHVTYRTSTEYAREDAAAGTPWRTYHPFAVQCVARTDYTDHATGLTTTTQYAYHDARYDPDSRDFVGFGRVDSDQIGDATCPTLRVETVFHVGLDPADPTRRLAGDEALKLAALRRKPLQTTVYGLDGSTLATKPYSVTLHAYDTLLVPSSLPNGDRVAVPYATSSTEQRWERGDTMVSTRTTSYLSITDEGDVTKQRTVAQRTGISTADQDVTTTIALATGGTNLRLPARVTQTLADGTVIAASVTYYDGDPFIGLPEGQATLGLISRIEDLVFDDAFVTAVWGASPPDLTQYGYHRLPGDATGWWRTRRAHQRGTSPSGPTLATKGPLGAVQTLQYDASRQRVIAVTDAKGNRATATIDARVWQTASLTDANGRTTRDVFDALGRVVATIGALHTASLPGATYAYTPGAVSTVDGAVRVTHGGGELVHAITYVDGTGSVMGKATPALVADEWIVSGATVRNARGLTHTAYLPYLASGTGWTPPPAGTPAATSTYDALGRLLSCARPDGLTVTTRREGSTVITSETWEGGASTDVERQVYDATGQLISVSRNAGDHWVEQQYAYTPSGSLGSVVLPGGAIVTFLRDKLGRIFQQTSPDTGRTNFLIDACDNQRLRTNAAGQIVRTEVDALNRTTAVYHDEETAPRVRYEYLDAGGPAPSDGITANRYARAWRITDEIGEVVLQYDESGRETSSARSVANGGATYVTDTAYDALGRVTNVTYPAASTGAPRRSVAYGYGADGRLTSASGVVTSASYDVYGRMTQIAYANGTSTTIDYVPNAGGVARVRATDATSAVIRDTTVGRSNGAISALTSTVAADDSVAFEYDPMRRLSGASYARGATPADAHAWAFDDAFRVMSTTECGAIAYMPGTHRIATLGATSVEYDVAGRLTKGRFGTATFDGADHLTGITLGDGTAITHRYDARGRRARTTTAGAQSYLRPTESVEVHGTTAVVWIQFGNQRVAADVGGELAFLHANALGVVDLITDATGKEAARVRQTPFGGVRPASGAAPGGSAAVLVALMTAGDASGLSYVGLRWYDPLAGQFTSPDPVVTSAYTVGAWNPYIYCLDNPIALADPSGCSFLTILEMIGIAILAAACVVAAIWTGGATLVALGVIASNIGGWLLAGVAIGSLGGALAGEIAAQKAGGNLWAGAFVGALLGGASSLIGGAIGGAAAAGIDGLFGASKTLLSFVAAGAIQGTLAGAGTGLAIGYAGGKGTVESALIAMAKGAAWGATLGALLGLGVGSIVGTGLTGTATPDAFLNIGAFGQKFADTSTVSAAVNSADNWGGVQESITQLATQPSAGNVAGLILPNLLTTSSQAAGWFSIPLTWLAPAVLEDAGFAAAVDASMAMDQAGFSYAHQLSLLIGAAPYFIDYAINMVQILDPKGSMTFEVGFNNAYGSGSPTNTG